MRGLSAVEINRIPSTTYVPLAGAAADTPRGSATSDGSLDPLHRANSMPPPVAHGAPPSHCMAAATRAIAIPHCDSFKPQLSVILSSAATGVPDSYAASAFVDSDSCPPGSFASPSPAQFLWPPPHPDTQRNAGERGPDGVAPRQNGAARADVPSWRPPSTLARGPAALGSVPVTPEEEPQPWHASAPRRARAVVDVAPCMAAAAGPAAGALTDGDGAGWWGSIGVPAAAPAPGGGKIGAGRAGGCTQERGEVACMYGPWGGVEVVEAESDGWSGGEDATVQRQPSAGSSRGEAGQLLLEGAAAGGSDTGCMGGGEGGGKASGWDGGATKYVCSICLDDYEVGERLRILPCQHRCSSAAGGPSGLLQNELVQLPTNVLFAGFTECV